MVNLKEVILKTGKGDRLLFISPFPLQSKEVPSLLPPIKAHVYENLIKEDWLAHLGDIKIEFPKDFERNRLVIKYDQDFEKAYLGYLIYSEENAEWKWSGESVNINKDEIEKLEFLLSNYRDNLK